MGKKSKKKAQTASDPMTSRNWEQWRDADDHTGDRLIKGNYETPQDYIGSEEYQANQPIMRANQVEQALIFMRKLLEKHHLTLKSDGVIGEKILIVLDAPSNPDQKIKDTLLKAYQAAGYGSVKIDIRWE